MKNLIQNRKQAGIIFDPLTLVMTLLISYVIWDAILLKKDNRKQPMNPNQRAMV
jgi:hypothetical protein